MAGKYRLAGKGRVAAPLLGGAGGGFTARRQVTSGSLHYIVFKVKTIQEE
ncbi:MAG: hypothetical protein AVDCRST_MAG56-5939 [uncultured Cytophagales bacterium]|uniref:Uncharacterized protein n=1 Tax=uncultured Cytophagales bacterium TaxID=158755 RepID=A0A6J4KN92_9SPHI|nr:MAG: hypothetical protein AVDCRST_MAG56-5939 [uncultured Cytophagales bacterium]